MQAKVLEIVIDGYGYDPELEIEILKNSCSELPPRLKTVFIDNIFKKFQEEKIAVTEEIAFILFFNRNPLNIYFETKFRIIERIPHEDLEKIKSLCRSLKQKAANQELLTLVQKRIEDKAWKAKYAVWAASTPNIDRIREQYPSLSTKPIGIEAGYEKLDPEVQGNSETGHQQLGNLTVAPQVPLEIAIDIENNEFSKNPILNRSITTAVENQANLNVSFMISGEEGDDGRVHSCWNHLENYLSLVFNGHKFDPARFRIQAILDGRDSPSRSSLEKEMGKHGKEKYGFLYKLKALLSQYHAEDCIAWIIGRGTAMDRDYEEERTRKDYELLVEGKGIEAADFNDAVRLIEALHEKEKTDPEIEPIIVKDKNHSTRKLENNDVFVDLNFRADRQRARIASLLGAQRFLQEKAANKGKKWKMDWIKKDLKLAVFCIAEYHPDFEKEYGAKIAYPIKPQQHNFLVLFSRYFKRENIPFKYLLIAESNKAAHIGYFIKGRRETIENGAAETRIIIPSYAEEDGIFTDDDFYKTPQMRAVEISKRLIDELTSGGYNLAIVNLSNPDMLGHLIIKHFDENVRALAIIDDVVNKIVEFARQQGYYIIITSDHGNIDAYSSSHSLNDVITTFVSPAANIEPGKNINERIRLFDIPWAIAEIFNITAGIKKILPEIPDWIEQKKLVGETPIKVSR
ncbi:MAG: alkaline phosphatase family protein [Candidatus Aminicenantes bacterium]|nr:alkaline phosphatase family protein [Candidatus Aminicenantes bacterium]